MDIIISNSSGEPIYNQITSQIKEMILDGKLKEGDALPSMRALAQQLRDNVENRGKPTPTPDETGEITVGGGEEAPAEETPAAEGTN